MKQRIVALLTVLALMLSLCAVTALAGEGDEAKPAEAAEAKQDSGAPAEENAGETVDPADGTAKTQTAGDPGEEAEAPSPAGPDPEPAVDPETGEALEETAEIAPDAVGSVSFANLERRIREKNLTVLSLQENIAGIEGLNYEEMSEQLRKTLHQLATGKWQLGQAGMWESFAYTQLEQAYHATREQFDAIKKGELQADNAGVVRQLKNLQDQIVMAGESMYVAIAAMEQQEAALERQLAAMNRTVEEMELRYQLGQISALQLQQTKAGRTSLVSGMETLQMNIRNYKLQLELLIGAELTGKIRLEAVPQVKTAQLDKMDEAAGLAQAKEKSYELFSAKQTLEDAKDAYVENISGPYYLRDSVTRTLEAAKYTYSAAIQDYELRFHTLYAQVMDYRQILDAAQVSLACEEEAYAAQELKYQQGTISQNALLEAADTLRTAEEKVAGAANDLFSAYNSYCWAVQHGILN